MQCRMNGLAGIIDERGNEQGQTHISRAIMRRKYLRTMHELLKKRGNSRERLIHKAYMFTERFWKG